MVNLNKKSNILICGAGSVGIRHAKNLIHLGYKNLIFFTRKKKILIQNKEFKRYTSLNNLFKRNKPLIAFITNETSKHIDTAINCANHGCDLFIEKPLTHKTQKVKKLIKIINKKRIINMVGYMLRFHPIIKILKKLIKEKKLGKIYHFYSEWGEYLPYWHPNENFKKSYAANKKLGGGALLTLSHDLDLLHYFFGKPKNIVIKKFELGLKINAETAANIFIEFKDNLSGFVHIDYLQKKSERYLKIAGTKLVIKFFYLKNLLLIIKNNKIKKITLKKFKRNDLFINEIKYFLKNCKNRKTCSPNINESYSNLLHSKLI